MAFFNRIKSGSRQENDLKKHLVAPFIPEFSEYVQKLRRNSMAISSIALVMYYSDVSITSSFSVAGFQINGLTDALVKTLLLILSSFWLLHFAWCSVDYFMEWRIRLTGVPESSGAWDDTPNAAKSQERGFTFMRWLYYQSEPINQLKEDLTQLREKLWSQNYEQFELNKIEKDIAAALSALGQLPSPQMEKMLRISLNRFENFWRLMNNSQSIRWLLIELLLPLALGLFAIAMLTRTLIIESQGNASGAVLNMCNQIMLRST